MPASSMTVSVTNSWWRRTPPDGGYGIREKPRHDAWGTGEPVVHEDEWTVPASRRIGPSGTQPGGVEGKKLRTGLRGCAYFAFMRNPSHVATTIKRGEGVVVERYWSVQPPCREVRDERVRITPGALDSRFLVVERGLDTCCDSRESSGPVFVSTGPHLSQPHGRMNHMLVKELLGASLWISQQRLHSGGDAVLQGAFDCLAKRLIAAADARAWRVREDSVAFYPGGTDEAAMTIQWCAVWSPLVARFVGGEYDGDEMPVSRSGDDGLPPELLTLPYRASFDFSSDTAPSFVIANPSYTRAGTHPVDDVWVYEIV